MCTTPSWSGLIKHTAAASPYLSRVLPIFTSQVAGPWHHCGQHSGAEHNIGGPHEDPTPPAPGRFSGGGPMWHVCGTCACRAHEDVAYLCSTVASSHKAPGSNAATHNVHGQRSLCQGSNGSQRLACARTDAGRKLLGRCAAVQHHSCSQVQCPAGGQQASARPGSQGLDSMAGAALWC